MTAKPNAQRQREFKARMAEQGLTRCFVYARPEHHAAIKAFAAGLQAPQSPDILRKTLGSQATRVEIPGQIAGQ